MLPFRVRIQPGQPAYQQVVFAATRAIVAGEMAAGSAFPSVRELSLALKINPNTAHKVVGELVRGGMLEVVPGVGTVVARRRAGTSAEKRRLLRDEIETLVVEARRLGLGREDIRAAVDARWAELFGEDGRGDVKSASAGG